jgi:hypothetical protein
MILECKLEQVARLEDFTVIKLKNVVLCDIKAQFVLHRGDIMSQLLSPAD